MKKLLFLGFLVVTPVLCVVKRFYTQHDLDVITVNTVISNKGKTYNLIVKPTTTIHDIKNHISIKEGIGVEYQRINGIRMVQDEGYRTARYPNLDDLMLVKTIIDACKTKQFELVYKL